jgi:hypothetical protein
MREAGRERARQTSRRLAALKAGPCGDCGLTYPPYVMQFDHLNPRTKTATVSQIKHHRLERVVAEIAKCELVCANCHAVRTHKRREAV